MKKIKLILLILTNCLSLSFGQLGLQGGLNVAKLQVNPQSGTNSLLATLQAGILFDVSLTDHWYITPELKYISKGTFHQSELVIFNKKTKLRSTIRLQYIEMLYDIAYRFDSDWFLGGGLYLAHGLDATGAQFGQTQFDVNPIDFGFSFKIGKRITDSSVTIRYSQGLSNISRIENTTLQNRVLSLIGAHHFTFH